MINIDNLTEIKIPCIAVPKHKQMWFSEIAITLKEALYELDLIYEIKYVDTKQKLDSNFHYVYCIEEFQYDKLPDTPFICLQFEQLEARLPMVSEEYKMDLFNKFKKCYQIWDYSTRNVNYMKEIPELKSKYIFVPYGYSSNMEYKHKGKFDIEIYQPLFYGNVGKRRKDILDKLGYKLNILVCNNNLWNNIDPSIGELTQLKNEMLWKFKICINIKYDEAGEESNTSLETCRILPMIANRCLVISEYSGDKVINKKLNPHVVFCKNTTEIEEKCRFYMNPVNKDILDTRINNAYRWLINYKYSKHISELTKFKYL